jgi:hypothetical protein
MGFEDPRTPRHAAPVVAYLAILAGIAACGGSNSSYPAFANDSGFGTDGTISGDDAGNGSSGGGSSSGGSSGGGTCASNCTSDQECQNSCPAAPSGSVNCCDVGSGTCMMMNQATCPAAADGSVE